MNGAWGRKPLPERLRGQRGMTLVELLVGIIVMGILSTLLLLTWFSLNNSYSFSVRSYEARDNARLAVSRMEREIRDMQGPRNGAPAVQRANADWIAFYTTFNEVGNSDPELAPHLVAYRLYADGTLWRFEDGTDGASYLTSEQAKGAGATLVLKNLVNATAKLPEVVPLFRYSSVVDEKGTIGFVDDVGDINARRAILGVQTHLMVDLNPGKAPIYVDFTTLAQLRNQRSL